MFALHGKVTVTSIFFIQCYMDCSILYSGICTPFVWSIYLSSGCCRLVYKQVSTVRFSNLYTICMFSVYLSSGCCRKALVSLIEWSVHHLYGQFTTQAVADLFTSKSDSVLFVIKVFWHMFSRLHFCVQLCLFRFLLMMLLFVSAPALWEWIGHCVSATVPVKGTGINCPARFVIISCNIFHS